MVRWRRLEEGSGLFSAMSKLGYKAPSIRYVMVGERGIRDTLSLRWLTMKTETPTLCLLCLEMRVTVLVVQV
uniref:Uncharacterized protein n=1 Tax=Arundo donax TaxID=35708 RepID=A0A0A8XXZ9_ARUDO